VKPLKSREILEFEAKVENILAWSVLDAGTKDVLHHLMQEVVTLAEKQSSDKGRA